MTSAVQPTQSASSCGCVAQHVRAWLGAALALARRLLVMELNYCNNFLRE